MGLLIYIWLNDSNNIEEMFHAQFHAADSNSIFILFEFMWHDFETPYVSRSPLLHQQSEWYTAAYNAFLSVPPAKK